MNLSRLSAFFSKNTEPFLIGSYCLFGFYLLYTSWLRWPDAGVDFGYFLYNTWQVSEGAIPGIDFHYYYGPLSLFFYALFFKLFGPSISIVYGINFFLLVFTTSLIHGLFRRFSLLAAALATLSFLGAFALGQYIFQANYNFMAPYKPDVSFGTPILLLLVYLLLRARNPKGFLQYLLPGLVAGSLFLTSTELALAALSLVFVFLFSVKISRNQSFVLLLSTFALPFLSLLYFTAVSDFDNAITVTFRAFEILSQKNLIFSSGLSELMGIDRPWLRIFIIFQVSFVFFLVLPLFAILGKYLSGISLFALAFVPVLGIFLGNYQTVFWLFFPKMLPIFPLLGLVWWLGDRKERLLFGLWSILSLALLLRLIGNAMFHYYGFSLAFPALLIALPLLIHVAPQVWERYLPRTQGFLIFAMALVISIIGCAVSLRSPFFQHKTFFVERGTNILMDWDPAFSERGVAMKELLQFLRSLPPDSTVMGLPDGHMLHYLSKHIRPKPYSLSLGELKEFGEEKILQSYSAAQVKFIFLAEPEPYDDQNGFGVGYGRSILDWLKQNYRVVRTFGNPTKFTMYERK